MLVSEMLEVPLAGKSDRNQDRPPLTLKTELIERRRTEYLMFENCDTSELQFIM